MRFLMEVACDGAAFDDGIGGRSETAVILMRVAHRVADTDEGTVLDSNGNAVGSWRFTD